MSRERETGHGVKKVTRSEDIEPDKAMMRFWLLLYGRKKAIEGFTQSSHAIWPIKRVTLIYSSSVKN